jgi:hypothetical protein
LPQPFFYDTDNMWADWFSTAVWAHESGAYETWLTIYPPLSFAILKFAGIPSCYEFAAMESARRCDVLGIGVLHGLYVLNGVLTSITFMRIDRRTAAPRAFAITAGMPMLFGLERGNLVLLCYTCVLLGWGPLMRSARVRWLFVGLAVNLKVYLIAGVLVHLLRRRWLWVEAAVVSIVLVWLTSYWIYGEGTPYEVYKNIQNWATGATPSSIADIWYANTYNPLRYVLAESSAPVTIFLGSKEVALAVIAIDIVVRSAQGLILIAAAATWLRPEVVTPHRVTFLGLALAMITSETSAYTQPLLFLFVFMEPWKGWLRPMAISTCYILCFPGEITMGGALYSSQFSFLIGQYVIASQSLGISMLIRPLVLILPVVFLATHTILQVWRDVRVSGWEQRWRYRHDKPILPRITRPSTVGGASSTKEVTAQ